MLLTSLNKLVVKGREFTIVSTLISKVCSGSSFRLVPWVFNTEVKMVLALLICLSHTPPILLAEDGFCFHSIHWPPLSLMKSYWSFVGPFLQKLFQIQKKLQQSCYHYLMLEVWCFLCDQQICINTRWMNLYLMAILFQCGWLCWISMWAKPHNALAPCSVPCLQNGPNMSTPQ